MSLHVAVAVVVPSCLALAGWQASRALSGNTLSWAYTFEWPVFAGYALFMWWRLLHEPPPAPEALAPETRLAAEKHHEPELDAVPERDLRHDGEPTEDPALAEYNDYLAALSASGRRKRW